MEKIQLLLLFTSLTAVQGENILLFFFPSYSHIRGTLDVARELVSRGHVVWNALPTYMANDERFHVPGVKHLVYTSTDETSLAPAIDNVLDIYFESGRVYMAYDEVKEICGLILRDEALYQKARKIKFDFVILSTLSAVQMLTIFAYRLDLPFIFIGPYFSPFSSRSPFVASTFPVPVWGKNPEMDFPTRLMSSVGFLAYSLFDPYTYSKAVALYAPEKPYLSLDSLTAKGLLWLVDLEPLLNYPQALLPNVKFVGSLSAASTHRLPEKYQRFMDESKNGVVIVSFGFFIKRLPLDIQNRLLEAFKQTGYRYIIKYDKVEDTSSDILFSDWMPQRDLLVHPNAKLFITNCGANSINEAFVNGVPMLGLPLFSEQHSNAEKIVYRGYGLKMNMRTFTVEELVTRINELITNSSYSDEIKRAAAITKLRNRSPIEESVYWIEHVMQYGGEHLRSYCQDMPLYQFLNLDVIGLLLFVIHLSAFLIWKVCCCCCRRFDKPISGKRLKRD